MNTVFATMSMSLDGYIAGPNISPKQGLGLGGERLHEWMFGSVEGRNQIDPGDAQISAESHARAGAVIIGRRMLDTALDAWGNENPFGMTTYVVTNRDREPLVLADGNPYIFVPGIQHALENAIAAAGDRDFWIGGGASVIQQFIAAGKLDELPVSVVPVLFGRGSHLFAETDIGQLELVQARVIGSPAVTHITYHFGTN